AVSAVTCGTPYSSRVIRKSTTQVSRTIPGLRPSRPGSAPRVHPQTRLFLPAKPGTSVAVMSSASTLESFLAEPRNVIVAGVRKDGRPHLSPNWFLWDGENFYVSTTRGRAKYRIFQRDPRAELVVDDPTALRYVEVPAT